jgi:peptide-methionine (S)-S-oxide reductase
MSARRPGGGPRVPDDPGDLRLATFAAGCFWNVEAALRRRRGVLHTAVGFSGGELAEPEYRDVASGRTGHAEVVRVQYDPAQVRYEELLEVFWSCHDPCEKHRPPGQVGSQYRSIIFTHDAEQELIAKAALARLEGSRRPRRPVLTEIRAAARFYMAADHHQQYLEKRSLDR